MILLNIDIRADYKNAGAIASRTSDSYNGKISIESESGRSNAFNAVFPAVK